MPRVARKLPLMHAPHEHAQHPCHRVLSAEDRIHPDKNRRDVCATRQSSG